MRTKVTGLYTTIKETADDNKNQRTKITYFHRMTNQRRDIEYEGKLC